MRFPINPAFGALALATLLACGGCAGGEAVNDAATGRTDPLTHYEAPAAITCVPPHDKHKLWFMGGGVLSNDSPATTYTVTKVALQNTTNLVQVAAYLVPGVEGGGMLNAVSSDLTPYDVRHMTLNNRPWPWASRIPAEGAQIGPGQSAEVVVAFREQAAGPWRFYGIQTDYRDATSEFTHIAPASGTNNLAECPS